MGVAVAIMRWFRLVCPSCNQKRESFAFDLILEALVDFQVPVSTLLEIVYHFRKGAKFGVEKGNSRQNISSRDASVGNENNL